MKKNKIVSKNKVDKYKERKEQEAKEKSKEKSNLYEQLIIKALSSEIGKQALAQTMMSPIQKASQYLKGKKKYK